MVDHFFNRYFVCSVVDLEFRIRILPMLFKHVWKLFKKTPFQADFKVFAANSIQKEESTSFLPFSILHNSLQG